MTALSHPNKGVGAIRQPIAAIAAVALTIFMIVVAVERVSTAARWTQVGLGSALWDGISTALVVLVPAGLGIWKRKTVTAALREVQETTQLRLMEMGEQRQARRADKAASRIAQHDPDIRSSDDDDTGYGTDRVSKFNARSAKKGGKR